MQLSREKLKKQHDEDRKMVPHVEVGSKVMAMDHTRQSKWDPIYEGPFTVKKQSDGGAYVLSDYNGEELERRYTVDMLKVLADGFHLGRGRRKSRKREILKLDLPEEDFHYVVQQIWTTG